MIVCKIELWPKGSQEHAREIGRVVIANDGTGTTKHGNYLCALAHGGKYSGKRGAWKSGRVTDHLRRLSPYHLLLYSLKACLNSPHKKGFADLLVDQTKQ